MGNAVNSQQVLQALVARMAQARGQDSLSGIPGASSPPMPGSQPGPVPIQASPQAPQPQQGGMPGAAGPQPQPPINQVQPGAARQLSPASPAPFNGTFGDRRGVISQLVNSAEKRSHDKKVNEASMYYSQINSFLASNDPKDQAHAQQLLDDPKVRKILKAGLDYVPLEEEVPPEAIGVHQAQQKIDQRQSKLKQIQQMLTGGRQQGNAQPRPQGRAIIPQASQASQQAYQLGEAKTEEQRALAAQHEAEAIYDKQKADAETSKAETERLKLGPERVKAYAQADEALGHAKWYKQQAKSSEDLTPTKKAGLQAGQNLSNARAEFYGHLGKYYDRMPEGRLSGTLLRDDIKSTGTAMNEMLKGFIKDNQAAALALSKDQATLMGRVGFGSSDLIKKQEETKNLIENMRRGMAYFYGDGKQAVLDGTMTVPEAAAEAYRIAGISPPDAPDEEPERPAGVPENAEWDPETRTWSVGDETPGGGL